MLATWMQLTWLMTSMIDVKVMLLVPASEKTVDFLKNRPTVTNKDDMESVYLHI